MESDCMGFYAHCCWKHSDGPWCPPAEIYTWPMTSFVSADVQVKMVESLTNLVPQQLILSDKQNNDYLCIQVKDNIWDRLAAGIQ